MKFCQKPIKKVINRVLHPISQITIPNFSQWSIYREKFSKLDVIKKMVKDEKFD